MDVFSLKFDNSSSPTFTDVQSALEEDLRLDMVELGKIVKRESLQQMKSHYKYRRWNKLVLSYLLENL